MANNRRRRPRVRPSLWFVLNIVAVLLLGWLALPLADRHSAVPVVLGRYSVQYAAYLTIWAVLIAGYAAAAIIGSARVNRGLLIAVAITFISGEIAARWLGAAAYYTQQADQFRFPLPYVHFIGQPLATLEGPPRMGGTEDERRITLNALGLRGAVPPMPKREYRVLVLGGSTVFNGAPLAKSIPGYLDTSLRAERPDARVYNWGVTSYVSGQELALLTQRGAEYTPDLVVAYDGGNDMIDPFVYDPRPGYPFDWMVNEAGLRVVRGGGTWASWPALFLLRSRLLTTVFRDSLVARLMDLPALRAAAGYDTPEWRRQIATAYARNLSAMCTVARGMNAEFAAFLQPTVFTKQPLAGGEPVMLGEPALQAHMRELYGLIRSELNDRIGMLPAGCTVTDLTGVLNGISEQLFWDVVHVTNDGNKLVADRLHAALLHDHPSIGRASQ